jgi:hypothetical protein
MSEKDDSDFALAQAGEFVAGLLERYQAYHDHKERMVYAGFALYAGAFGAGLISSRWPPAWVVDEPPLRAVLALGAVTIAWALTLSFLSWQLRRRRLAAIRVAGAERLLAKWSTEPPKTGELRPWKESAERGKYSLWRRVMHTVWPPSAPLPQADLADQRYPGVLVSLWKQQESSAGTGAESHEKLIVGTGWSLYFAVVLKTVLTVF